MDSELLDAGGSSPTHDDMESTRSTRLYHASAHRRVQAKLATVKNASSLDDVDESDLSLGLFAYPVLQAADVLLYK